MMHIQQLSVDVAIDLDSGEPGKLCDMVEVHRAHIGYLYQRSPAALTSQVCAGNWQRKNRAQTSYHFAPLIAFWKIGGLVGGVNFGKSV